MPSRITYIFPRPDIVSQETTYLIHRIVYKGQFSGNRHKIERKSIIFVQFTLYSVHYTVNSKNYTLYSIHQTAHPSLPAVKQLAGCTLGSCIKLGRNTSVLAALVCIS